MLFISHKRDSKSCTAGVFREAVCTGHTGLYSFAAYILYRDLYEPRTALCTGTIAKRCTHTLYVCTALYSLFSGVENHGL